MLASDRTLRLKGLITYQEYQVAGGARIHLHALVAVNPAGYLVPASDTAGVRVVGLATHAVDNTGAGDGARACRVYKGAALIPTTGAAAITQAHVGRRAYALDDEQVVAAAGVTQDIDAGEVLAVEDGHAWVNVGA